MVASATAQRALDAYGGVDRWRSAEAVEAVVSAWGWAFRLKWCRRFTEVKVHANVWAPRVRITPYGRPYGTPGGSGVLDGPDVRIEDASGVVIAERKRARDAFAHFRRGLWWDRLDQMYFAGYALWNYFALPAMLLRTDIVWAEVADGVLQGRFPPTLPTHCTEQTFHFDRATGLLMRHDYTADVIGAGAHAAHLVTEHGERDGVPFPSRRRVVPRRSDGGARSRPLLIGLDVHEWRLI